MHWIISHLLDSMKYTFTFSFRIDENQPTHQSKERNMKRKKKFITFLFKFSGKSLPKSWFRKEISSIYYMVIEKTIYVYY